MHLVRRLGKDKLAATFMKTANGLEASGHGPSSVGANTGRMMTGVGGLGEVQSS